MSIREQKIPSHLHALRLLYFFMFAFSLYLLFISRSGEVHTVWEAMHPAFIPMFFATTFLLLTIIFSLEKAEYKLSFIILHSVLSHIFFVIVFPAGNVGVQQEMLGKTRLVFDNIVHYGFGWTEGNVLLEIYVLFRGGNLQTAFSVGFARMFGVDVCWSHLLLIPLLWGVFVPIIAFKISKTLGSSEKISVLSSLLVSLFPANILWGAVSLPNGLSYLFFFCLLYFLLKYVKSNTHGVKDLFLLATFFFASFLSHYLAGTIALSFLILAWSIKTYEKQKGSSPISARFVLLTAFIFCASIMPFALAYRRFFYPWASARFSIEKLLALPITEIVLSLLLGDYFGFISRGAIITTLIFGLAPLLGFIGMLYILIASVKMARKRSIDPSLLFLSLGLLMVVVDDRIVKFFMINVPFVEFERLWLFRDFLLVSFLALVIGGALQELRSFFEILSRKITLFLRKAPSVHVFSKAFSFFAHGHLVKGISFGSVVSYFLVISVVSGWVTASVYYAYPQWGLSLFIKMKSNPSNETLIEAMKINNSTTAYFIIEKPRLGTETYSGIIDQAQQSNLQTYKIFYYPEGEEKLRIFYYKEQSAEN